MWRIILVDDDLVVRRGIVRSIDWEKQGLSIASSQLTLPYKIRSAKMSATGEPLAFTARGGKTAISLQKLDVFHMLTVE